MPQALEWFQCKTCGRRQRWRADIAGKQITCACGSSIVCPAGPVMDDASLRTATGVLSDTLVEDVDAASASSVRETSDTLRRMGVEVTEVKRRLMTPQEREATKQALLWLCVALVGLTVFVHAVFLMKYWLWWYTTIAVLFAAFSFWKFYKAKRRWQKGRPIMESLSHSLGADTE